MSVLTLQPLSPPQPSPEASSVKTLNTTYNDIAASESSWVTASDVDRHLSVMAAFHKLHHLNDEGGVRVHATTRLPVPTLKQMAFLTKAQQRFKLWLSLVIDVHARHTGEVIPLQDHELPPLDVLLVLHSYMLAPHKFSEDCSRLYPQLASIGKFPFEQTVCALILLVLLAFNYLIR